MAERCLPEGLFPVSLTLGDLKFIFPDAQIFYSSSGAVNSGDPVGLIDGAGSGVNGIAMNTSCPNFIGSTCLKGIECLAIKMSTKAEKSSSVRRLIRSFFSDKE